MKLVLILIGPYAGRVLTMADADAATAVTDAWGIDLAGKPYPWDSSQVNTMQRTYPQSPAIWLLQVQSTISAPVNVTLITKTNPAVVTVGVGAIGQFNNGDRVLFSNTSNALLDMKYFTVSNKNAGTGTFAINLDLTSAPADIAT